MKDWLLDERRRGVAIAQGAAKALIVNLAGNVHDTDAHAYVFGMALAPLSDIAKQLDLPRDHQLLALASHALLNELNTKDLWTKLSDEASDLMSAAREYRAGAPLVAMALCSVFYWVGTAKERERQRNVFSCLESLASLFPGEPSSLHRCGGENKKEGVCH